MYKLRFLTVIAIFLTLTFSKQIRPKLITDELEEMNKEKDEFGDPIKGEILRRNAIYYSNDRILGPERPYGLAGPRKQYEPLPIYGFKGTNYIQYPIQGPICPPGPA